MGCRCGQKAREANPGATVSFTQPRLNSVGMYEPSSIENCTTPYSGMYRSASVLIVGYGSEDERIFRRAESTEAVKYAKEHRLRISHVPAHQLCHDSMVEFLGA